MSGSIVSQEKNNVENSIHSLHNSTASKENTVEKSSPGNVASAYDDSFDSASTRQSSKNIKQSSSERQISGFDLSSIPDETQSLSAKSLSPWEKWLCSKEEEKRQRLQKLTELRRQKEIENRIKEENKLQKKLRADAARERWLKQVEEDQKKQIKVEKEKLEQEKKLKEEKEHLIREISSQKYHDWKSKKDKLKEEKQREEELKMQTKLQKLQKKKQLNEEAFKKWLKEVSIRPKSQNYVGYGYAGGVMISYYDRTSSPRPSYFNPRPWIPCTDNEDD